MDLDLRGRIANTKLPLSHGLHPLFEAISNSVHAIEEARELEGQIDIDIIRNTSQGSLIDGEPIPNQPPIAGIRLRAPRDFVPSPVQWLFPKSIHPPPPKWRNRSTR